MYKIENIVKEYSSAKLKEIIEHQSDAYSEKFIDFAKDELIKRGETFPINTEFEKEVAELNDNDLKNLVEKEWNNYHLEYLEIARKEYLKRKLTNETRSDEQEEEIEEGKSEEPEQVEDIAKRYPKLRKIVDIYSVLAWAFGVIAVAIAYFFLSQNQQASSIIAIIALMTGAFIVIGGLLTSELIKVVINIEENTRR